MITLPPAEPSAAALQTILLVEDDSATRALLHRTLDSAGYVVIDVANGEKAIQFATHLLPDLVVLDIQLLDMDGWHIITRLREYPDTRSLPILAISAHPEPACADGLANLSFLSKPLEPEKLLREVQRYIQQRTINFT
jgi:CheY-like chemotaxis protein